MAFWLPLAREYQSNLNSLYKNPDERCFGPGESDTLDLLNTTLKVFDRSIWVSLITAALSVANSCSFSGSDILLLAGVYRCSRRRRIVGWRLPTKAGQQVGKAGHGEGI